MLYGVQKGKPSDAVPILEPLTVRVLASTVRRCERS